MTNKPNTIDEYLKPVDPVKRKALEKLRATIRRIVPKAEECISYGLPCFRLNGKALVGFGAGKNHCAFYPWSGRTVEEFAEELAGFETSKGAIRFQPENPLPVALIRRMVKSRVDMVVDRSAIQRSDRGAISDQVDQVIALLKRNASKSVLDGMARYGLPKDKALGVSVGTIKKLAAQFGKDHELAVELWETDIYEARMMCSYIDDPAMVTPSQMDRWSRDFDNWGICDAICFHLFDRTPHAWKKVTQWATKRDEFVKRGAFALLWGLTVHDKSAADDMFLNGLVLIENAATDERHYVKKAVNMALRATGKRNSRLRAAAITTARRLAESPNEHANWIGRDALRELERISAKPRKSK